MFHPIRDRNIVAQTLEVARIKGRSQLAVIRKTGRRIDQRKKHEGTEVVPQDL